jgi:hypothetical protein
VVSFLFPISNDIFEIYFNSWMVVVDKCLKNKNVRSTKCKRKCQKNIMSVEEVSGVCKDRVKWRAICRGGKK